MGYEFDEGCAVKDEVRRIATERIDATLEAEDMHEQIHEIRKKCKEVRALLRLVRGSEPKLYKRENARFRDIARRLSELRDAHALVELIDAEEFEDALGNRFALLRDLLVERRDRIYAERNAEEELDRALSSMKKARETVTAWKIRDKSFGALADGLEKTYRRGRRDERKLGDAPSVEALHEWRKRCKYHRYHCELLRGVWPELMEAREDAIDTICDDLGDDQDLARFAAKMHVEEWGDSTLREACEAHIEAKRADLVSRARATGARVYAEKPGAFRRRVGAYWKASRA